MTLGELWQLVNDNLPDAPPDVVRLDGGKQTAEQEVRLVILHPRLTDKQY